MVNKVAKMYDFSAGRSISKLIQQIKQGWKGHVWEDDDTGEQEHKAVTADLCQ